MFSIQLVFILKINFLSITEDYLYISSFQAGYLNNEAYKTSKYMLLLGEFFCIK